MMITQYQKILLIGAVRSVKHTNISKYQYSGYDISFNKRRTFSFPIGGCGYDVIIFGADMSHFVHVDNKKKDIFILDEDPTQGLDDTTLTTEKNCSTNFTEQFKKKFCLNLHYSGANSYLFVIGTEICKSKAKYSEIVATL